MLAFVEEYSFYFQFWFAITFALGSAQMMTDEFFFGGACIGALLTAIILLLIGRETAQALMHWTATFVLCGLGGLAGATLIRRANRKQQDEPDINDEPYDGE